MTRELIAKDQEKFFKDASRQVTEFARVFETSDSGLTALLTNAAIDMVISLGMPREYYLEAVREHPGWPENGHCSGLVEQKENPALSPPED